MDDKKLDLESGEMENDMFRRCRQTQCGFFQNGGCMACETCKAPSFILRKSCERCWRCENVANELRFGNEELQEEMETAAMKHVMEQQPDGVILVYNDKASPGHRKQEEELLR